MAFRLPTQAPPRRTTSYSHPQPSPALDVPPASSQLPDDESTQWVLFSPSQPSTTARTHTNSTERTAGASRLSDLNDSFGTQTRSVFELGDDDDVDEDEDEGDNVGEQGDNDNDNDMLDEEGTELDSLDDGLHAFRAPSLVDDESPAQQQQLDQASPAAAAVLPTHDGLGSFQASSQTVQDHLWQHEQYNPQRRPELRLRRQSSVQRHLDMVAEQEQMTNAERERWQRIEKWRMEQSRALLQEVERETRRRRRRTSRASRTSDQVSSASFSSARHQRVRSESLQSVPETPDERPASLSSSSSQATEPGTDEPFWRRITRKVIRDLIGIDDSVLSVIFGESLPDDVLNQEYDNDNDTDTDTPAGTGSTALKMDEAIRRELGSGLDDQNHWQTKLLQRIAHELGVLVHQLCEHPGAFTTYLNLSKDISNEYAGIPISRTEDDTQNRPARTSVPSTTTETTNDDSVLSPHFGPTLPDPSGREHAAQWGIEEDDPVGEPLSESARLQQEKEYWERELDIMMVFRYLRNRFSDRNNNTDSTTTTSPSSHRQPQDASRRAAIIRQHHPLVARAQSRSQAQHSRRQSQHSAAAAAASAGPTGISSPLLRQNFRRPSSSCASHSAKLSAISSRRTLTGSSRNYWDIGGSVESGSAIAPVGGGMGSWGDV